MEVFCDCPLFVAAQNDRTTPHCWHVDIHSDAAADCRPECSYNEHWTQGTRPGITRIQQDNCCWHRQQAKTTRANNNQNDAKCASLYSMNKQHWAQERASGGCSVRWTSLPNATFGCEAFPYRQPHAAPLAESRFHISCPEPTTASAAWFHRRPRSIAWDLGQLRVSAQSDEIRTLTTAFCRSFVCTIRLMKNKLLILSDKKISITVSIIIIILVAVVEQGYIEVILSQR